MTTPISLTDPDATFGDDSGFTAGMQPDDAGAGDDSGFQHGPVVADGGAGDDTAVTVAAAVALGEAAVGDDLPWQFLALGLPVFPYYADLPALAATRVRVGDQFLWYAPGETQVGPGGRT